MNDKELIKIKKDEIRKELTKPIDLGFGISASTKGGPIKITKQVQDLKIEIELTEVQFDILIKQSKIWKQQEELFLWLMGKRPLPIKG